MLSVRGVEHAFIYFKGGEDMCICYLKIEKAHKLVILEDTFLYKKKVGNACSSMRDAMVASGVRSLVSQRERFTSHFQLDEL